MSKNLSNSPIERFSKNILMNPCMFKESSMVLYGVRIDALLVNRNTTSVSLPVFLINDYSNLDLSVNVNQYKSDIFTRLPDDVLYTGTNATRTVTFTRCTLDILYSLPSLRPYKMFKFMFSVGVLPEFQQFVDEQIGSQIVATLYIISVYDDGRTFYYDIPYYVRRVELLNDVFSVECSSINYQEMTLVNSRYPAEWFNSEINYSQSDIAVTEYT